MTGLEEPIATVREPHCDNGVFITVTGDQTLFGVYSLVIVESGVPTAKAKAIPVVVSTPFSFFASNLLFVSPDELSR